MSIHVMNLIWRNARYQGNAMLALLALADWSNDDGVSWPSVESIAKKSRQSERNTRIVLQKLVQDRTIYVTGRENNSSVYRINLEIISDPANFAPLKSSRRGGKRLPNRGANAAGNAEMFAPNTSIEPSVDTSEEPSGENSVLHAKLMKHIFEWWEKEYMEKCPWNPECAGRLALVIRRFAGVDREAILLTCVDNRFKSEFRPHDNPEQWIPNLLKYRRGPLNEFGHPRNGIQVSSAPSVADELRKQGIEPMPLKGRR